MIGTARSKPKTKVMNEDFMDELDKIGLEFSRGTLVGRRVALLEAKNLNSKSS